MSNARRLRQQKELEALQASAPPAATKEEHGEVDEEEVEKPRKVANPFAALGGGGEEEEEEEEEEESATAAPAQSATKRKNKNKKKKKSKASQHNSEDIADDKPQNVAKQAKAEKKKKRGLNEIDQALQELNMKYPETHEAHQAGTHNTHTNSTTSTFRNLLSVDHKQLDASVEMKKMFGSKVVSSATTMNSYGMGRQGGRNARAQQTLMKAMPRSHLSKYKPTWPPPTVAKLDGIGMRALTSTELSEWHARHALPDMNLSSLGNWWTFVHEPQYKNVQHQFLAATGSFDPNTLMALLQVYPYHVDTLNQVSEVFRMQGDNSNASDFTERVLFAIERAFPTNFNVLSGQCRLDFDRVENRSLWLALTRLITHLCMKGCWRTAFEYAKLMLSLDPLTDPYGALLWIDFLGVKAGQHDWIISAASQWPFNGAESANVIDCTSLPGIAYAKALSTYFKEKPTKQLDNTVEAFREAISGHPLVLELLRENGLLRLTQERDEKFKDVVKASEEHYEENANTHYHRNAALARVYYSHSHPLYRDPSVPLQEIVNKALDGMQLSKNDQVKRAQKNIDRKGLKSAAFPENVARHVIINNIADAKMHLPQHFSEGDAFDPVKPSTSSSGYDEEYFTGIRLRGEGGRSGGRETGGIMSFIESLLRGEFNLGDLGRMDPDMRVALEEQVNQLQEAGMPGGFGSEEYEEGEGGEEEDEEESESESGDDTPQNPGIMDRFARMFGANNNNNDNNVD